MFKFKKVRLSHAKAQELVKGHKLRTCGMENLLPTGAKLKALGGGWWLLCSYHYAGKDIEPYI
jgi:hypothetical protein